MLRTASLQVCIALLALVAVPGCQPAPPPVAATAEVDPQVGSGNLPLAQILAVARRMAPGRVIEVELESDVSLDDPSYRPRWIYEVEILTADNRVVELEIDAKTGQLLELDGAPWPAGVPKPAP